ncbi:hypothetical protein THIAE_06735 [Thiomicrospira aerophila AL3]|uniref:Zinc-dependent peptidase n=1 Tax=Thiomicrospira aerophila AL3 TaxID=717772 RepID=W0DX90_9GAMM|nr:M90 family metallopeptidase [Thiomicrospira aerophila]AHF01491.1 hypothetical protein THIAE_06735 [Thiomicrospira aerophila AL3]
MNLLHCFKHWRIRRILRRYPVNRLIWRRLMREDVLFSGLSSVQKAYLRELTTLFIQQKRFHAAQGLELTEVMQIKITAHACLLILELGLDYYQGWRDIIVYPEAFWVERDETDENGIVSHQQRVLGGEAWLSGPVVLAWQDFDRETHQFAAGRNLVLHEFAHKLDMLNGAANGKPPLHSSMDHHAWTLAFSQAFEQLRHQLEQGQTSTLNPYAASEPAEFFAVSTEYFFTAPDHLAHHFPRVYQQLSLFYRQDPLT